MGLGSRVVVVMTVVTLLSMTTVVMAVEGGEDSLDCALDSVGKCYNKPKALRLKIIAIASILVASMLGVCLPLFSRSIPALRPDKNLFVIVKAFASGVILSTGFMHVLPDSFEMLLSPCLPSNPWQKFPFSSFVSMLSAVGTLMLDSFSMAFYKRRQGEKVEAVEGESRGHVEMIPAVHGHCHGPSGLAEEKEGGPENTLRRNRVIAQVLEFGIVVHSVVIGLSMGASESPCTIQPLVAALCFHQFFEGMGLGGCILQAEYGLRTKAIMVFFFAITTPFGIALGIGLSHVYRDNSPTSLIVIGLLNASSSGLLIYMALVDLLAADFLGHKLQGNVKLQGFGYVAVFLGMGGMSLMAVWA
ncbi:fe(2+) transport protein 1-like [Wolffia australiana]